MNLKLVLDSLRRRPAERLREAKAYSHPGHQIPEYQYSESFFKSTRTRVTIESEFEPFGFFVAYYGEEKV